MSDPKLHIVPLGGLGEFGMNSMAIRYGDDIIVIDAGMMFPDAELLGVDIVTPDFAYLEENRDKFAGSVPDARPRRPHRRRSLSLSQINSRSTGPPSPSRWSSGGWKNTNCSKEATLHPGKAERQDRRSDPFEIEFIHVTHSIVSAVALAITTPLGVIIHTGDFKVDPTPTDNELFDLHTLADYGKRGVLLLLSDSTNVDRPGYTESERAVRPRLEDIFNRADGRLVVSCFSSSIHRLQTDSRFAARVRPQGRVPRPQHEQRHRDRAQPGSAQHSRRHAAPPAGHHDSAPT